MNCKYFYLIFFIFIVKLRNYFDLKIIYMFNKYKKKFKKYYKIYNFLIFCN